MRLRKEFILFVFMVIGLILLYTVFSSSPKAIENNHRDYSMLKRSKFDDILERDKMQSKPNIINTRHPQKTVTEMRENWGPPRVIKDSIRGKMRVIKENENIVEVTSLRNCSNLFSEDNYIRDCVTGNIVGNNPLHYTLESLTNRFENFNQLETSKQRKQSFINVYSNRAWGSDWDLESKHANGSGNIAIL